MALSVFRLPHLLACLLPLVACAPSSRPSRQAAVAKGPAGPGDEISRIERDLVANAVPMRAVRGEPLPELFAIDGDERQMTFGTGNRAHVLPLKGGIPFVFEVASKVLQVVSTSDRRFIAVRREAGPAGPDPKHADAGEIVELFHYEGANLRSTGQFRLATHHGPGNMLFSFTRDGALFVFATDASVGPETASQQIAVVDTRTGAVLHRLGGPAKPGASPEFLRVNGADLSSDDRTIVAAFGDHTISAWDTRTGALLATLRPAKTEAFSGNDAPYVIDPGTMVAFPSAKGVGVFRFDTRTLGAPLLGPECTNVRSLALGPTADAVAAGTTHGRLCVFDIASGRLLRALDLPKPARHKEEQAWWVASPQMPSSEFVQAHTLYEPPHRYDVRTSAEVPVPPEASSSAGAGARSLARANVMLVAPMDVNDVSFDGRTVVFGSRAGVVRVGEGILEPIEAPEKGAIILGAHGKLSRAEPREAATVFHLPAGGPELVFENKKPKDGAETPRPPELAISPDGALAVASATYPSPPRITLFDTRTGKAGRPIPIRPGHYARGPAFCFGGKQLAFLAWTPAEHVMDAGAPMHLEVFDLRFNTVTRLPTAGAVAMTPHPTRPLLAVLKSEAIEMFELDAPMKPPRKVKLGDYSEDGRIDFSADGTELALTTHDIRIRFFDAATLAPTRTLTTDERVHSVSYTPDGLVIAAAASLEVKLFDAKTLRPLGALVARKTGAGAIDPEGRVEILGDRPTAEGILLCRARDLFYPYGVCRAHTEAKGILGAMLTPH